MFFDFTKTKNNKQRYINNTCDFVENNCNLSIQNINDPKNNLIINENGLTNTSSDRYKILFNNNAKIQSVYIYSIDKEKNVYKKLHGNINRLPSGYLFDRISDNTYKIYATDKSLELSSLSFYLNLSELDQNISVISVNQEIPEFIGLDGQEVKILNLFLTISSDEVTSDSVKIKYDISRTNIDESVSCKLCITNNTSTYLEYPVNEDNEITIDSLYSNTDYSFDIYAECTINDMVYKSNIVTIYFKTLPKLVKSIKLNVHNLDLKIGNQYMFNVQYIPEDADYKEVVWESSNEDIVSVNNIGKIVALRTVNNGNELIDKSIIKCTLTTDKNIYDTCEVKVNGINIDDFYTDSSVKYRLKNDKDIYIVKIIQDGSNVTNFFLLDGEIDKLNVKYNNNEIRSILPDGGPLISVNEFKLFVDENGDTVCKKLINIVEEKSGKYVLQFINTKGDF